MILLFSALHVPSSALAQEINWRTDYVKARREAVEKDRPLVIDFGTENCYWCKQLDARTFRDPIVVGTMNDRFIALKIDAQRDADLAQKLRIQNYPTTVIASPDGKILATLEGFVEAARFQEQLQRTLDSLSVPDALTRDYQEASKAIASSDFARAIGLLKSVVEDGKDRPVQVKASQLLQELEQQAASRLAQAKQQAEKGQTIEAKEVAAEVVRLYGGAQAASEAGQFIAGLAPKPEPQATNRARQARELLAQARDDYRSQQILGCLDRCELLSNHYSDMPEALQASQLAAEIKRNPEWMKLASDAMTDRLCGSYLSLAESYLQNGQPLQASLYLERVIQAFPNSRQAETAQLRLLQIESQPTRPVEYQHPEK